MNMDNMGNLVMNGVESAAQMSIGQAILRLVDRILWIIEKSVQWSLPTADATTEENGKSFGKVELVRPLPWIFFLPGLLVLRMVRFSLNVGANILGYPTVEPSDMVRVIQRGRRRIRAIKSGGLKNMRLKKIPVIKDRTMTMKEASKSLAKSIRLTLSTLSCLDSGSKTSPSPPPTKIRVSNLLDSVASMPEERPMRESSPVPTDSKRKYSEISSDDSTDNESDEEPLLDKIDRLANVSGTDEDYTPDDTSDQSDSSDSEADLSISMTEVQETLAETEKLEKILHINTEGIDKAGDTEQHKTENEEKPIPRAIRPQQLPVSAEKNTEENNTDKNCLTTNGVSNEQDAAYYSPVSWKSVSPELGVSPEKQDNQVDSEGKPEELSNGEVNEKEKKNYDNNQPSGEVVGEVTNGHMKEKQGIRLHSSSSNKHYQKNKQGNHGNRKKK
jgi:hypothetical protein